MTFPFKKILISRVDNIGDVVLTIPMAGVLKKAFPNVIIAFLGKSYTQSIINQSQYIDEFYNWDEIKELNGKAKLRDINADVIIHVFPNKEVAIAAKNSQIKLRIGTSHRLFHWFLCNKLINLGRKNSDLHEVQLNLILLKGLGIDSFPPLEDLYNYYGITAKVNQDLIPTSNKEKFNLIFHPKSKGHGKEWRLNNFYKLSLLLSDKYNVFITGSSEEGKLIQEECPELLKVANVFDVTGKFTLGDFMIFINSVDGLIASGTGPLHISAALGKHTLGLFPSKRPIHPGRWAPLGRQAIYVVSTKPCSNCVDTKYCECMDAIEVNQVFDKIKKWKKDPGADSKN